jgi:hypothetical protein
MLNLCGIVVAILKMVTGRNFSMSGINSDRFLEVSQISPHFALKSREREVKSPCFTMCDEPEMIPDIENFLPVTIFKMATTHYRMFPYLSQKRTMILKGCN